MSAHLWTVYPGTKRRRHATTLARHSLINDLLLGLAHLFAR